MKSKFPFLRIKYPMEPYVSAGLVAVILGLNPFTVYKMAQRGQIPSYKFGRSRRFRLSEVEKAIQRQCS
jgi:excisionase family DNA binding protein